MTEAGPIVLDVFPACIGCGWAGYPRYSFTSEFTVRDSQRLGGRFYVMRARCPNCGRTYRMRRPVGEPTWVHDLLLEEPPQHA